MGMTLSGTKIVLAMGLLAVAASVGNWCYRTAATGRSVEFWGPSGAQLLSGPQTIHALKLLPAEVAEQQGLPARMPWPGGLVVVASRDVTQVRGLAHLRHALVQDRNYGWSDATPPAETHWRVALVFAGGGEQVTAVFSDDWLHIGRFDEATQSIDSVACPDMADEFKRYFSSSGLLEGWEETDDAKGASTDGESDL